MTVDLPAVVIQEARDHYAHYGIEYPTPGWTIGPDEPFKARKIHAMFDKGFIWFYRPIVRDVEAIARVSRRPTVRLRLRAWRACGSRCEQAAKLVLHESAHAVQVNADPVTMSNAFDTARVEGYAEAVAVDLYPSFIKRLLGKRPPCLHWVKPQAPPGYPAPAGPPVCDTSPTTLPNYAFYVWQAVAESVAATGRPEDSREARWYRLTQLLTPGKTIIEQGATP